MLRVLTRGIGDSSGLAMALTPVRPAYTLFAAKHKCRAAQTYVHLLGCRSETNTTSRTFSKTLTAVVNDHVRHAVSMTSGCNSEESTGVRWQEQGLGREVNVVQLMWIIKCFPPPHIHPGGDRPFCSAGT